MNQGARRRPLCARLLRPVRSRTGPDTACVRHWLVGPSNCATGTADGTDCAFTLAYAAFGRVNTRRGNVACAFAFRSSHVPTARHQARSGSTRPVFANRVLAAYGQRPLGSNGGDTENMRARVAAVHSDPSHAFSKAVQPSIELVKGHGVLGDAHFGVTVKHRSRVARDPTQPSPRQVHLLHEELFAEVAAENLEVQPGQMGENITTRGLRLLRLSSGSRLRIGSDAVVEITGRTNLCSQIESFKPGLLAAVLGRSHEGALIRKAGVMGPAGAAQALIRIARKYPEVEREALASVSACLLWNGLEAPATSATSCPGR